MCLGGTWVHEQTGGPCAGTALLISPYSGRFPKTLKSRSRKRTCREGLLGPCSCSVSWPGAGSTFNRKMPSLLSFALVWGVCPSPRGGSHGREQGRCQLPAHAGEPHRPSAPTKLELSNRLSPDLTSYMYFKLQRGWKIEHDIF